jgi:catechol 2,3-dioxygenase-like lactoylglutathione lyase family enzyme
VGSSSTWGWSMWSNGRLQIALLVVLSSAPLTMVQSSAVRPLVTGISHVAFRVSDATSARRFYGEVLGLSERSSSGGGRISYAVGLRQRIELEPGLPAAEDERLSHLAFGTPDTKTMAAYLRAKGLRVEQPADRCEEGAIRVIDPDGHPIEFVQVSWPPDAVGASAGVALSNRVLHAGLTVGDEHAAHQFYRDALGFSEIWRGGRPEGVTQWVNMRVPDGTDYLEYMLVTSPPDRRQRGTLHHVCLLVPDIQAAWEESARRTASAARAAMSRPNVGVNGRWQLNLYDSDGTRVELMEPFRVR